MKMHQTLIIFVLTCCNAFCEDTLRKRIIPTHSNVSVFSLDSAPAAEKQTSQLVNIWYQVLGEDDSYVVVAQRGKQYKVRKQDVVEIRLAEQFFTDQIRRDPRNADAFMRRATARRLQQDAKSAAED